MIFATPSPRLIPEGEKPDTFTGLALAPDEGVTLKEMTAMATTPKTTTKAPNTNVHDIRQARQVVELPEGLKLHSKYGFLRCGRGPDDVLAPLAEVLLWLMEKRELPCETAVDLVCDSIECHPDEDLLYLLDDLRDATVLPPDHSFSYVPLVSFWDEKPKPKNEDCGLPGAVKAMREYWGQGSLSSPIQTLGQHVLDPLAIRLVKANELWGYGTVVAGAATEAAGTAPEANADASVPDSAGEPVPLTAQAIKDGRGKNKRGEWLPEAKKLMLAAYQAAGENGEKLEEVAATFGFQSRQAFTAAATRIIKGTRSKTAQTLWPTSATTGATR